VRRSFRTCIENNSFTVKRWTLCVPADLSEKETVWFTNWKHQQVTDFLTADRIDWWGESTLHQLLLQPKNAGIKEEYFHQEHLTQIRKMYRMLTHFLEDFATRPEESVMALALRQDAKDANLRYRDEVYGPLHTELKRIRDVLGRAHHRTGPYPQRILLKDEPLPGHLKYTMPASWGPTFIHWYTCKEAYRLYGALTSPARDRLDEIEEAIAVYNVTIEEARKAAAPSLSAHVAQALEAETQLPDYLEWKHIYKDNPNPPSYQSFPWFELLERITLSGTYSSEQIAYVWLRYPLQTFGWLLAHRPDVAGQCVSDDYERSAVMPRSLSMFQDALTRTMPELEGTAQFQRAKRAQEHLYHLVASMETALLSVDQLLQQELPGYASKGSTGVKATLTLAAFEQRFRTWLLEDYHQRIHEETGCKPAERWEAGGFLPRMPKSLEQLDLLLLTVAKTRRVQQDGIRFQGYRYLDPTLAAYVKEEVVIRYDPADLAEIRVFYQDRFLCRAICQELAGQTISLKEIQKARTERRQQVKAGLSTRAALVEQFLVVHQQEPSKPETPAKEPVETTGRPRLKRYINE
jgi:hypothetical protein